jgi:hypothetical protein
VSRDKVNGEEKVKQDKSEETDGTRNTMWPMLIFDAETEVKLPNIGQSH